MSGGDLGTAARRLALALLLAGCAGAGPPGAAAPTAHHGRVVVDTLQSSYLAGNPLGDSPARELRVYLPPGYGTATRRLPVVYLLHGFGGSPEQWTGERFQVAAAMDSLIASGRIQPLILVIPDGHNALGGSFFADAAATGRWGSYLEEEVVTHVDARYRTLATSRSRGVVGYSMGGRAALDLAARRPDRFGAVYAMSPCCLGPALLQDLPEGHAAMNQLLDAGSRADLLGAGFHARLAIAALAVFAPERPVLLELVPFRRTPGGDPSLRGEALDVLNMAAPGPLVQRRRDALASLRAIGVDAGEQDAFTHIPVTVRELSRALGRAGISHRAEIYQGTHGSHVAQRLRDVVLPFLSEALEGET
jgi:S-formylglutathione hydrolase